MRQLVNIELQNINHLRIYPEYFNDDKIGRTMDKLY